MLPKAGLMFLCWSLCWYQFIHYLPFHPTWLPQPNLWVFHRKVARKMDFPLIYRCQWCTLLQLLHHFQGAPSPWKRLCRAFCWRNPFLWCQCHPGSCGRAAAFWTKSQYLGTHSFIPWDYLRTLATWHFCFSERSIWFLGPISVLHFIGLSQHIHSL